MEFLSVKWLWLYAGVFLMLMEILTPGFVIFFFGLAAATVGGLLFLLDLPVAAQAAFFSVFSIVYLVGLRRFMMSTFMSETAEAGSLESEYVGRVGKVVQTIRPEVPGRILLGDAEWAASAAEPLAPDTEVRVVAQRNLTLSVEKL